MIIPDMRSTFGWYEFEVIALEIIKFAQGPPDKDGNSLWNKPFLIKDVTDSPELFAVFAASGWVQNWWFPQCSFIVSDAFLKRLKEKHIIDESNNITI